MIKSILSSLFLFSTLACSAQSVSPDTPIPTTTSVPPTATSQLTPAFTPTPTLEPTPTHTPTLEPTATAVPTPTLEPTPTPEPALGPSSLQMLNEELKRQSVARSWDAFKLTTSLDVDRSGGPFFPYGNCNPVITEEERKERLTEVAHPIACWAGNVGKDTETFHVPYNEWVISWWTAPDGNQRPTNFIMQLHTADGANSKLVANFIGASDDYTVMRGVGDYYLEISTTQLYSVMVLAPK